MVTCPVCGKKNDDNWPVLLNDVIVDGGCQDCWETQCDEDWWKEIGKIGAAA